MKTLITCILLFCIGAAATTVQLPRTASQCRPAGSLCTNACLIAVWGPGNGSSCQVSKVLLGQIDWYCSDTAILTHEFDNKFCHCEWDYSAAIAIAVNPAPNCQPNPTTQDYWPYSYYCV